MDADSKQDAVPALRARDLRVAYPGGVRGLNGVSVEIRRGEFVGLIGPNGSGKSTLLRCLAGLMTPDSGEARIGETLATSLKSLERARRVALVQASTLSLEYSTAFDFALLGRYPHLSGWRVYSKHDRDVAEESLRLAGALEFKDRLMTELASGERQRVMLARAFAQGAPVLLLDEPTSALDAKYQLAICALIQKICKTQGKTVIAATHDLNLASQYMDRLYLLNAGTVAAHGTPDETLTKNVLESVYGIEVARGYFTETIDGQARPWVLPKAQRD